MSNDVVSTKEQIHRCVYICNLITFSVLLQYNFFQNFLNSLASTGSSVSTHPCPCSSFGFALLGISKGRPVRDINMLRGPNGSPPLLECHVQGTSLLLFSHPRQLTQPLGVPSSVHPPHAGQTGRLPNSIPSHSTYKRTSKGIGRNLDLSCESVKFFKRPSIVSSFKLCSSSKFGATRKQQWTRK